LNEREKRKSSVFLSTLFYAEKSNIDTKKLFFCKFKKMIKSRLLLYDKRFFRFFGKYLRIE